MKLQNEAWRHRKRRSREDVKKLVDEFESSGSDRAEFCKDRDLALSTLQHPSACEGSGSGNSRWWIPIGDGESHPDD